MFVEPRLADLTAVTGSQELREALTDAKVSRWWAYRLRPPLENRFVHETELDRNRQIRFWIAVCLGFTWLTFGLDLITIPDVWRLALLLRLCVVTPVSLVAWRILGVSRARWWETTLACVVPLIAAHMTVLIGLAATAAVDTFRSAVVLCVGILWINVLVPQRLRDAFVFVVTTLILGDVLNIGTAFAKHVTIDHSDTIVVLHLLVALSLLVRFLAERESRHSFVLGLRLRLRADDLTRSNEKLREMSNTDPLTGLANRRFFDGALSQAWQSAEGSRSWLAVMMIDIDYFKQFNDVAGHLEGDRCLTVVAQTIARQVRRENDLAARFGGEEFIVLMTETDVDEARDAAERVRTAIAALRVFHPARVGAGFVSVSIGVAAMRPAGATATTAALLVAADTAMYAAKAAGRDRVAGGEETSPPVQAYS